MRKLPIAFLVALFYLFLPLDALAATLQITAIGTMQIKEQKAQYWSTFGSPTIFGTGPTNSVVNLVIDAVDASVTSDAGGNWNYTPSLSLGNHQISVASGQESLSFTLTIVEPSLTSVPTVFPIRRLPVTATPAPLLALLSSGGILLGMGWRLRR